MEEVKMKEEKPVRRRKKLLYRMIRDQIEFYLGDINLSKDRFFSNLLQADPYIDVEYFLKCKKIQKLTTNPQDIVKAMRRSELISVTEDGTKLFRTKPVEPVYNEDDCTIYVEDLPIDVDHDWLRSVFLTYGEVAYVSLPRFKKNNKIKGFAFVQFKSSESAAKALEAFKKVGCCLSSDMQPEMLRSVETFEGNRDYVRWHPGCNVYNLKYVPTEEDEYYFQSADQDQEISEQLQPMETVEEGSINKKDAGSGDVEGTENSNLDREDPVPRKKQRTTVDSELVVEETNTNVANLQETFVSDDQGVVMSEEMEENEDSVSTGRKKKTRKSKRKNVGGEEVITYGMQILAKKDWKKLRNKYLEEQKRKARELKFQLHRLSLTSAPTTKHDQADVDFTEDSGHAEEEDVVSEDNSSDLKYSPGLIVKLLLPEPIADINTFKMDVRRYPNVLYVDAQVGGSVAYVRFSTPEATACLSSSTWEMHVLQGEEEHAYWQKVFSDREEKRAKKENPKVRGRAKLRKKAEAVWGTGSHVRFGEFDNA